MLDSDKEYFTYTLTDKEAKLEKLYDKVNIIENFTMYLESFLQEKEDWIRALKNKLSMNEMDLTHPSSMVSKLGLVLKNLMISSVSLSLMVIK